MKFVALVSGGKDSIYSILECVRNGHELMGCVHLAVPNTAASKVSDGDDEDDESYMYQSAASEVLPTLVQECLGVPLILYRRKGTSSNTSLVYDPSLEQGTAHDEVEDMYEALQAAKKRFPQVQAVSSGAILSTYQRVRIENVCIRLGLVSLSYLWRLKPQQDLLELMLQDGIVAVLVKVACPPGLMARRHLNKTLGELYSGGVFGKLQDQYQFHMCGEGGEYESLVVDCPLYKKKLVLDEVDIIETDDGVGVLAIKRCHAEAKETPPFVPDKLSADESTSATSTVATEPEESSLPPLTPNLQFLPRVCRASGGLLHISEIVSPNVALSTKEESEADLAVQEARSVLNTLKATLDCYGGTALDVLMVHLYLSEISHFASINAYYREFFGTLLPPSRSCVAVGRGVLPGGRRVLMDCLVQLGSGQYMRDDKIHPYAKAAALTKTSSLRQVLHVQSISHWAPVCVGPYSQVNTLRSGIHFLAGQIGLEPSTMTLRETWTKQLEQCWKNVARVLDALDGCSLAHCLSCLVYVSDRVLSQDCKWRRIESICRQNISTNADVVPGAVESQRSLDQLYDGYEDEGTWREMTKKVNGENDVDKCLPMLFVSIPEMPVGALAEVEVICTTRRAAECLDAESIRLHAQPKRLQSAQLLANVRWDTGHDFSLLPPEATNRGIRIQSSIRSIGHGCATMAIISASIDVTREASTVINLDLEVLLVDMLSSLDPSKNILHVRLYYVASTPARDGTFNISKDGTDLRCMLNSVLGGSGNTCASQPTSRMTACTVVPVQALKALHVPKASKEDRRELTEILAMQVLLLDPVGLETEIWIHHGRDR